VAQWPQRQDWEGLTLSEIHLRYGRSPGLESEVATLLDVIERGATSGVYRAMSEDDIARILQSPLVAVASDGGVVAPGEGRPHPRSYGTNARVLARYVREKQALPLEQAVQKMTSLPARSFMLLDRGLIAVGMQADLVLFDPAKVQDNATFDDPHRYSTGFDILVVNGQVVFDKGATAPTRPAQNLRLE
jgi:N-acyl-D-amino-acid deacylase